MNNEDENILLDEDVILPDDFDDIPTSDEEGKQEVVTEEENTILTEENTTNSNEDKDKEILEYLNTKGIKYNGEEVKLNNLEDLINNYQKGLNYDKKMSRDNTEENEVLNFISEKAKSVGVTPIEYIKQVQAYEQELAKTKEEEQINEMVYKNNIPEELARELIENRALRKQIMQEKAELEEKQAKKLEEEKKDKEFEEFIKEYPNVEAKDIPVEVFEDAKNSTLLNAYIKYENKKLKEKLNIEEQNKKNTSTSVIKTVTDKGTVEQEGKDAFLEGFDS